MKMLQISNRISLLVGLSLFAGGMAGMAQPVLLVHPTNTQWQYTAPTTDPGFGTDWKDPLFGDGSWSTGRGLFGTETTVYPYPLNTTITPPSAGGPNSAFFRVHFNWASSTQGVILTLTNYIDDGMVVYLNGTEIYRFNINGNAGDPVVWSATATSPTANPGGEPVTRTAGIDPTAPGNGQSARLIQGDNVLAVFVGQAGTGSSDIVFGMDVRGSQAVAPTVQHPPPGGTNINVAECRTFTMTVQASGIPAPTFQWRHLGTPITGQTGASLTVTNARPGVDDGAYTVEVSNGSGTVISPAFNVTIAPDNTAPTMVRAQVNGARTQVIVSFSEPIAAPVPGAGDEFLLFIQENAGGAPLNDFNPATFNVQDGTNMTVGLTPGAWVEGTHYRVFDQGGGAKDACNNIPSPVADIAINVPFIVQDGLNGYAGTQDTELRAGNNAADTPQGDRSDFINIDTQDGTPAGVSQALIRFDNLFGNGPNQIPLGSTINSAILRLNSSAANANGNVVNMHRMLVDWNEATATWNSLVDGVTNDNVEAVSTAVANWNPNGTVPFFRDVEVRQSLQEWANGSNNFGWVIIPTGTDGYRIDPSEHTTPANRPMLTVDFSAPNPTRLGIAVQPPPSLTTNEGAAFSISVTVTGNAPNFVWQKLQSGNTYTNIPGATSSTYTRASAIGCGGDNGTYRLIASNSVNSVTSSVTVVTINADTTRPVVTVQSVGANRTTLVVHYSKPVSPATGGVPGSYSITPSVAINTVTLSADGRTATIETAARTFRTTYTLRVTGVRDTTCTGNLINPNPTDLAFEQNAQIITAFNEVWKYETNNLDGTAWTSPNTGLFDDSLWFSGPGMLGLETTAGTIALLNVDGGIQTTLIVSSNIPTYYFRKFITVPSLPTDDLVYEMHHYIDDGAVAHVNGSEAWRLGFTNTLPLSQITFTNYAAGAPAGGEASKLTNNISLTVGQNLIAVEVHQQNATSSDVVFGAEIVAVHRLARPVMTITRSGANVTVSWSPAVGQLEESTDLVNWSNSSRANGTPSPPSGGNRFYRVRR